VLEPTLLRQTLPKLTPPELTLLLGPPRLKLLESALWPRPELAVQRLCSPAPAPAELHQKAR
jgi:hypothetical protein